MKKFILLMLIGALTAAPVLSCAADDNDVNQNGRPAENGLLGDPAADVVPADETEELSFPELPDVYFEGHYFRILNSADGHVGFLMTQLFAESETGEALNDAIFRRNRRMEERFGFSIVQIDGPGPGHVRDRLRTSVSAGSDDFDMGMMQPIQALPLAQTGTLVMIDTMPYINLSAPWWDQDMNRDLSIGNRLFFTASDFGFTQYSATIPIFFNMELRAALGLDCPYTLVREGRWTIDRFAEMGRAALRDLNGDGVLDRHDQWGYIAFAHIYTLAFMNGTGARYVIKDADDIPVLNLNTEGFINRFNAVFEIFSEDWLFRGDLGGARPEDLFANNQTLFWSELMHQAVVLRAMDADFGILPVPKLNEQQEHHIHGTGHPHVICIPATAPDLNRTGIILEALAAESRLTVLDVYFDTMLVNQVMNRDENSAEMLDIIFANRVYETGRKFWNEQIVQPIADAMRDMNRDIVSIIERQEPSALAAIERTVVAFLDH